MDTLSSLFGGNVLTQLREKKSLSDELQARINILGAADPDGVDEGTRGWNRFLFARRAAWNEYVTSASAHGLLDSDLTKRLTSTSIQDEHFRGAMAECMACWLVVDRLGHQPIARPDGRGGSVLDLGISRADGDITVEVKSPYAAPPKGTGAFWSGDHTHLLEGALDQANKQFAKDARNVLVIVPLVDMPIFAGRAPFMRAFYGDEKIVFTIDRKTGRAVGEPEARFVTEGKFMKLWPEPRFTRTGAVVCLRESFSDIGDGDDYRVEAQRSFFVLHNPNCPNPIPSDVWGDSPQFIIDGDVMRWTDGKSGV